MENILTFANLILLIALPFIARHYFSSYFSEKAKNLATKEDVAEITKSVESSKIIVSKKVENLEKQNQCFIDLYESLIELMLTLNKNLGDLLPEENNKEIINHQKYLDSCFEKVTKSYYRLFIYSNDADALMNEAQNVIEKVINIKKSYKKHFGKFKLALIEELDSMKLGNKNEYKEKVSKTDKAKALLDKAINKDMSELQNCLNKYLSILNGQLNHKINMSFFNEELLSS